MTPGRIRRPDARSEPISTSPVPLILDRLRHTLSGTQSQVADGVVRAVREAPPGRLEQLMRTPARRVVLDGIFWRMPRYVDRERARRVSSSVRWQITGRGDGGADTYDLEIVEGECRVRRGPAGVAPRLTITVDGAELVRMATGNSDALRALLTGRLALAGDVMFAARLTALFRGRGDRWAT